MMKVFLDTNIFLDMIVRRENRCDNENAALLLRIAALDDFEFFISPITVSNSFYISRKDPDSAAKIKSRLKDITILPMDASDVKYAMDSAMADKEDAMQLSCANRGHCGIIITRDAKHFAESPVPAISPAGFLAEVFQD